MIATALLLAFSIQALGSGLEPTGIGARGRTMGGSLVAAADDWTAVFYNPAGLVRLSARSLGVSYEYLTGIAESSHSLRNLTPLEGPDPSRGDFIDPIGDEPKSFDKNIKQIAV